MSDLRYAERDREIGELRAVVWDLNDRILRGVLEALEKEKYNEPGTPLRVVHRDE